MIQLPKHQKAFQDFANAVELLPSVEVFPGFRLSEDPNCPPDHAYIVQQATAERGPVVTLIKDIDDTLNERARQRAERNQQEDDPPPPPYSPF